MTATAKRFWSACSFSSNAQPMSFRLSVQPSLPKAQSKSLMSWSLLFLVSSTYVKIHRCTRGVHIPSRATRNQCRSDIQFNLPYPKRSRRASCHGHCSFLPAPLTLKSIDLRVGFATISLSVRSASVHYAVLRSCQRNVQPTSSRASVSTPSASVRNGGCS